MADSPSHRFGQIIGDLLEEILYPVLNEYCKKRSLFLDRKGVRKARSGKKLSWTDHYNNSHDLDFVIEKGGTAEALGRPMAFIEAAWRRYTKHSRAKAQEIQGAVLPIAEKYSWDKPFLGVVLAGVFTAPSIEQMTSSGFTTVLFPYESIVAGFASIGIDVAFDEQTADATFQKAVNKIEGIKAANSAEWVNLKKALTSNNEKLLVEFFEKLTLVLDRFIEQILIVPLAGNENNFSATSEAMQFVRDYDESSSGGPFRKFEIFVTYDNGDKINASFTSKAKALDFLAYVSK